MLNRNRIRCIALVSLVPCILAAPFAWKILSFSNSRFLSLVAYALFGILGALLLRDSTGESPKAKWVYGATGLYFSYFSWNFIEGTYDGFRGLGLSSLSSSSSGILSAWACALCALVLFGMMGSKSSFKVTSPLPVMATSWGLGVVATLTGVNAIYNLRLDGFFGTIAAVAFALAVTALGVSLVKGKQPHLACYGLGAVFGSYTLWSMFTNGTIKVFTNFTGTMTLYGFIAATAFVAVMATWALGAEVDAVQKRLAATKK
jgi:hypothetical protein